MGTLHITTDSGCRVTVKSGTKYIYDGDPIYEDDELTVTCIPYTGYSPESMTANYISFGSEDAFGYLVGVVMCSSSDLYIVAKSTPNTYRLYKSAGTHSTISVKRTSSPIGGALTTLSNGDIIYYRDVLEISCAASYGYMITQLTVNDANFTSGRSYTVSTKNVTIKSVAGRSGLVYIDNGSSIEAYQCFIDNGSGWDQYMPYIDNGSSWDLCS